MTVSIKLIQKITLIMSVLVFLQPVQAYADNVSVLESAHGELFICNLNDPSLDYDGYIKHCLAERSVNDSEVRITLNGETVWRDEGLLVSFDKKFSYVDEKGELSEIFLFLTSTGGTACPLEFTAIVISDNGVKAHGPFGNCMDTEGVQIEKTHDGVQFLFECWNNLQCKNYDREFAYTCFVSKDINQSITCKGQAYCSAYSSPEELEDAQLFYWESSTQSVLEIKDCDVEAYE